MDDDAIAAELLALERYLASLKLTNERLQVARAEAADTLEKRMQERAAGSTAAALRPPGAKRQHSRGDRGEEDGTREKQPSRDDSETCAYRSCNDCSLRSESSGPIAYEGQSDEIYRYETLLQQVRGRPRGAPPSSRGSRGACARRRWRCAFAMGGTRPTRRPTRRESCDG